MEEIICIVTQSLMKESLMKAEEKTVEISFDIDMKVFAELALMAHIEDKTFNDFVVKIIVDHISNGEKEEEKA